MSSILASAIYIGCIAWLFQRDFRQKPNITGALWIPTIWLLLIGSRSVAQWLSMCGFSVSGTLEEGTPVDAAAYFAIIAAGTIVLMRRRINLAQVFKHNRWLVIFLAYCFISILWSDFSFISFKRWFKILGHPIMALVVFTEPDPEEALTRMIKRAAYVLIPISILFVKYYPQWGRQYDPWSGRPVMNGITTDKNSLGCLCLILGFFFFWRLAKAWQQERNRARWQELGLCAAFLLMTGWMLFITHSSTSLATLVVAMAAYWILGSRFINHRWLGAYVIIGAGLFFLANSLFGIVNQIIILLGRNPTLTDRTEVWHNVLQIPINPILGTGFESFWLGERKDKMWAIYWWHPVQAHNGYLETYLNLGLVGLGLMLTLIVSAFRKGVNMMSYNLDFGRYRLGFLAAFVLYNWTEAAFKALHPVWFAFYLISINMPKPAAAEITEPVTEGDNLKS